MSDLTLMAVHAHPDDEAIGTGGILARYADEGIRTVLVTCTNGELGDGVGGAKPGEDGHAEEWVVQKRTIELEKACEALGVSHLERLGYRDSGMAGWPQNEHPAAFAKIPVEEGAARIAELIERYRPQVVVTYDDNGFYGHPDHIQAHHVTMAAARSTGIPRKVYETAIGRRAAARMFEAAKASGYEFGDGEGGVPEIGIDDELITTKIDVRGFVDVKRTAIALHESQLETMFFLKMPEEMFRVAFGMEVFVRRIDTTGAPVPETDLFAGLR